MRFWDASAIIPLCINEKHTRTMRKTAAEDESLVVWWGTVVECRSAIARLRRDGSLNDLEEEQVYELIEILSAGWSEILPGEQLRDIALRLLVTHPLKAADSLQLAAAIIWVNNLPKGHSFVCLDQRLRDAARKEGFSVLPRIKQTAAPS